MANEKEAEKESPSSEASDGEHTRALKRKLLELQLALEPKKFVSESRKGWFGLATGIVTALVLPIALAVYDAHVKARAEAQAKQEKELQTLREDQHSRDEAARVAEQAKGSLFMQLAPLVLGKNRDEKNCDLVLATWKELEKDESPGVLAEACGKTPETPHNEWVVQAATAPTLEIACADAKRLMDDGYKRATVWESAAKGWVVLVVGYDTKLQADQAAISLRSKLGPNIVMLAERAKQMRTCVGCGASGQAATK